jgi:hypothetical protein
MRGARAFSYRVAHPFRDKELLEQAGGNSKTLRRTLKSLERQGAHSPRRVRPSCVGDPCSRVVSACVGDQNPDVLGCLGGHLEQVQHDLLLLRFRPRLPLRSGPANGAGSPSECFGGPISATRASAEEFAEVEADQPLKSGRASMAGRRTPRHCGCTVAKEGRCAEQ